MRSTLWNKPFEPDVDLSRTALEIAYIKGFEHIPCMAIRDPNRYWEYSRALHFAKHRLIAGASILELGGNGSPLAALLANLGYNVVTGDASSSGEATVEAQKHAMDLTSLSWHTMAAGGIDFDDDSFDCVLCISVIEHIPDDMSAIVEMARVARGHLVLSFDFSFEERLPGPNQLRFYTPEMLGAVVEHMREFGMVPVEECDYSYRGNHITHQGYTANGGMLVLTKDSSNV